jgi:hypothetical protein
VLPHPGRKKRSLDGAQSIEEEPEVKQLAGPPATGEIIMEAEFIYTRHQTPRGSVPDADNAKGLYLLKNVSEMRLTYQIKLLAYMAHTTGKKLHIRLPSTANVHPKLLDYVREHGGLIRIERV